jgi:hypothetical protein
MVKVYDVSGFLKAMWGAGQFSVGLSANRHNFLTILEKSVSPGPRVYYRLCGFDFSEEKKIPLPGHGDRP